MAYDRTLIDTQCATELVRRLTGSDLTVTNLRRLHGGMVNSVLELTTDGEPQHLVAKLNAAVGNQAFERERQVLCWHRQHSPLPVPQPLGVDLSGELFPGSCLLMERLPGVNLAEAALSPAEETEVERQLAQVLAALHRLTRATYGSALEPEDRGDSTWHEVFLRRLVKEYEAAAPKLTQTARTQVERVLGELPLWLPEMGPPTMVHGDVWATNVLVDRDAEGRPVLTGLVDGGAEYADVEYELAYLLVFNTVGEAFFREYAQHHLLRAGFEYRCRVYWLHTMLLHIRAFGDRHYVQSAERLAAFLANRDPTSLPHENAGARL